MPPPRKRLSIGELCDTLDNNVEFKAVPIQNLLNPQSHAAHPKPDRKKRLSFIELVEALNAAREAADNATGPLPQPIKIDIPGYEDGKAHEYTSLDETTLAPAQPPQPSYEESNHNQPRCSHLPRDFTQQIDMHKMKYSVPSCSFEAPVPSRSRISQKLIPALPCHAYSPYEILASYRDVNAFRPLIFPHTRYHQHTKPDPSYVTRIFPQDMPLPSIIEKNLYCPTASTEYSWRPSLPTNPQAMTLMHRNTTRWVNDPSVLYHGLGASSRTYSHSFCE